MKQLIFARQKAGNPKPEQVKAARSAAGLTQTAAAKLIYVTLRSWQQCESGERRMHPAAWELFGIKTSPNYEEPQITVDSH